MTSSKADTRPVLSARMFLSGSHHPVPSWGHVLPVLRRTPVDGRRSRRQLSPKKMIDGLFSSSHGMIIELNYQVCVPTRLVRPVRGLGAVVVFSARKCGPGASFIAWVELGGGHTAYLPHEKLRWCGDSELRLISAASTLCIIGVSTLVSTNVQSPKLIGQKKVGVSSGPKSPRRG